MNLFTFNEITSFINIMFCYFCSFFFLLIIQVESQYEFNEDKLDKIVWCTKNIEEQYKCLNLTSAVERDKLLFEDTFLNLTCYKAFSAEECIQSIDHEKAHITTLDAGDVFTAGRFHSLIPIMQEKFQGGFTDYHAVAVIKKNTLTDVNKLSDLKNKKACFPWVGSLAGWTIPIYVLQQDRAMEVIDCNNQVKTASNFFNDSCAIFSLTDKYNPIGDNSDKLCTLCGGKTPGSRCTASDPYYGYDGAFRCLVEVGDIAFLRHSTVFEQLQGKEFKNLSPVEFELLCRDGRRVPLEEFRQCSWGLVPSDAVVTSSARPLKERNKFQKFLKTVMKLYSDNDNVPFTSKTNYTYDGIYMKNQNLNEYGNYDSGNTYRTNLYSKNYSPNTQNSKPLESFRIFDSQNYTKHNLLFQDSAVNLAALMEDDQSFSKYLQNATKYIFGIRECPVPSMILCVTSDQELEKCIKMKTALNAQILKPELICKKSHSHINCMQWIQAGTADISVFDAGDIYTGGLSYDLVPFMSEIYNLGEPEYYVVAVAKEDDPDTELTYLKGKNTCHTGINTGAGWTYPMAYLISNGWIRPYGCDSVRAAAEYFSKSCIPGAISSEYNTGVPYDNMCDLCHGTSYHYCRRDSSEDYFGHTGAFRCLVEGGGHVAFVKHTTVMESTGGKRKEWWARNTLNDDFELLCTDGTRAELHDYKKCNLGKIKANAVVTRGGHNYNETQLKAYINLLAYAQQLYGRKNVDAFSFSMFTSPVGYYDLIFQDATRQLQIIPPHLRRYDRYLGQNFLRARRITDCYAGSSKVSFSVSVYFLVFFIVFLLNSNMINE